MTINSDTLYWLFSTIAQTYGAIVGIIGMLTVFKFQNLSNSKKEERQQADNSLHVYLQKRRFGMSEQQLIEWWESDGPDKSEANKHHTMVIDNALDVIKWMDHIRSQIKRNFMYFVFYHIGIICISIFLLKGDDRK